MKPSTIFSLIFILHFSVCAQTGNSESLNINNRVKLPYESGMITYEVSGDATGQITLNWDRNGWRQSIIRDLTIEKYGTKSPETTFELVDGDLIVKVNIETKKGNRSEDHTWGKLSSYKSFDEVIQIIYESDGGILKGDTSFFGKTARIWTFDKGTTTEIWEWQGIKLLEKKDLHGIQYQISISAMDLEVPILDSFFTLPDEVIWTD